MTRASARRRAAPRVSAPAEAVDADVAQIVLGLARINDPMLTYLMAMMLERVSELLAAARKPRRRR